MESRGILMYDDDYGWDSLADELPDDMIKSLEEYENGKR
tara:strand:+ start:32 stop:148 length:117 start_codon:yes stop_codon:yes gene_type:complete